MDDNLWQKLYKNVRPQRMIPTMVGFNVNLDRIITVTPALLTSTLFNLPVLSELRSRLLHSMHTCTAEEWFVTDPQLYQQFTGIFAKTGYLAIGGQAGIAAVHLAWTGISDVLCIANSLGQDTGKILDSVGVHLLDLKAGNRHPSDTIHLVFEYSPGLVPVAEGVIPRNNRFIASPAHTPDSVLIPEDKWEAFRAGISPYTRAFLSGYQFLQTEEEFTRAADQITLMKKNNEMMRVHVECVSVTDDTVIGGFVRHILPVSDSIGLNEHELLLLLRYLDPHNPEYRITEILSPVQLVTGSLMICRKCGLKRLHLHTFGYYVLILRKDCAHHPRESFNALLSASRAAAHAAQGSYTEISSLGISALKNVEGVFGPHKSPGPFLVDRYRIFFIPTLIGKNITKSAGLGDIISSSAFVADPF